MFFNLQLPPLAPKTSLECTDGNEKRYKMELSASTVAFISCPLLLMKATVLVESSILYLFLLPSVLSSGLGIVAR